MAFATDPREAPRLATKTPEERGLTRDGVRLLVSGASGHHHALFSDLPDQLETGDLLIVNRSATLPASLPAVGRLGSFRLNLCTRFGDKLWLAEPRWSRARPGPLPLADGELVEAGGAGATILSTYPGIPRLRFVDFQGDWQEAVGRQGSPIRYGYLSEEPDLGAYQTIFGDRPGSAEMPSAGRPFTARTLEALERRGVELVRVTLHTGVSSLEAADFHDTELFPERFEVDSEAALRLNRAASGAGRIIAIGTTTVRALVSAWDGARFRAARGLTRAYVRRGRSLPPIAGLLTGFHEPNSTHLDMLEAVAGPDLLESGYREALRMGYLWHEFGDVHLLLPAACP
ncbi:MAG TPA: S-adenosylmethionine:tRNA ribosyltransferase-isomerase [Trueperaceae bacterium]